ncbi:uncharacterized protein MELLADRAFT_65907 [Melampsora larici-populina 98AG31]|uniref:Aquaporin n=1 Tax=Melampsora larici-populina (strain 98AG31 / pathotype 3-4-7) TaxID=747676 RepID=F4RX68_MELLP|nr:uncharacterized protein MELLADRAFT_65907 [Melampsora larici-populina 98AG31]EGG02914.1 hypothetical protein MELLADRAFT_65907 [Melampsora larici-populina 98AG31]
MYLEKNSESIPHTLPVIALEDNQHIHKQPTHLTSSISEFIGVFIFVVCAETIKLFGDNLLIFGKFPVKDLFPYLLAQLLGATFGALCVHGGYHLYTGVILTQLSTANATFVTVSTLCLMTFTIEWLFAMLASMFIHLDVAQSKGKMFLGGPGCLRWLSVMYFMSVVYFFEARLVINTAYGMGVQIASWILQVKPLALQWSCAATTFVSLPAFMAGGALYKLRHPEKISRADSTEKCMEPLGSAELV